MTDWGQGHYELTAERLLPAAEVAVAALAPRPGERIVDVACGTGNAALLAARAGASVVGVDAAQRLVAVASEAAAAEGLDAEFLAGDAAALPFDHGSFDAAISVFGAIFAPPEEAARELLRVVRPGGRIVLTTWTSEGPTPKLAAVFRAAFGAPPETPKWSDPDFLLGLFAPYRVEMEVAEIAFTAESPRAYVAEQETHHPLWLGSEARLRELGKLDEVRAQIDAIFTQHNEDPAAFRTTSRYHLLTVSR